MISALPRSFLLTLAFFLTNHTFAEERLSPIRDDARLFHADTIARAETRIADIHRTFERRLFVQTIVSASPNQRRMFRFLWTPQVNRILEEQARKRAEESGVDGIYVIVCNKPHDVHVIVRPTEDAEFSPHDAEKLRRDFARRLHDGGADAALLALVEQVDATLRTHVLRGRERSGLNEWTLAGLLGGGFALWLLLAFIRSRMRTPPTEMLTEADEREQARQTPALLGAMFGCPAALRIYDKLYPCPPDVPAGLCEDEQPVAEEKKPEHVDVEIPPLDDRAADAPISPRTGSFS